MILYNQIVPKLELIEDVKNEQNTDIAGNFHCYRHHRVLRERRPQNSNRDQPPLIVKLTESVSHDLKIGQPPLPTTRSVQPQPDPTHIRPQSSPPASPSFPATI